MPDSFDFRTLPFSWMVALVVISAPVGAIGYVIASRKFKQPLVAFLARYAISFLLLFFFEYALLALSPSVHATMRNLTATLVGGILSLAGMEQSVSDSIITLQDPYIAFDVTVSCLGGMLFWAYTALVLAESEASNRQRIAGILIGLGILIGFNFFRITVSIYLEGLTDVPVHDYFYLFNMIFVLLVWAGWLWALKAGCPPFSKARPRWPAAPQRQR